MRHRIRDFAGFRRFSTFCLCCAVVAISADAQVTGLKQLADAVQGKPTEAAAKSPDSENSLENSLKQSREALNRLDADAPPAGLDAAEVESRRHNLEQTVLLLGRAIKNADALADARKKHESSKADEAAWQGFKEKPPYSVLMVDELLNERDAVLTNLSSQESSLANAEVLLGSVVNEAKLAETDLGKAVQTLTNSAEKDAPLAKWRMEAAQDKSRYLSVRVTQIQDGCAALKERVAAAKSDLTLIDRKVAAGRKSMVFSDGDLEKLKKIRDERKVALKKEVDGYAKRLKTALANRDQTQSEMAALVEKSSDAQSVKEGLELAKFRAEAAEERVEAIQAMKEGLEYMVLLEDSTIQLYQHRSSLLRATSLKDRAAALGEISSVHVRLKALETVLENEQVAVSANLGKLEARAASITSGDPRFSLVNDQRTITSERLNVFQRIQKAVTSQRRLARRWINEYTPEEQPGDWSEQLASLGTASWAAVKKLWSFELTHFEEKVLLNGRTFTSRTPFTLGTLLKAVLFFTLAYMVLARIANRIQNGAIRRGHIADAQAKTLRNWGMIVAGFFLILGTFGLLKIPLTVFAFFGGAMAIGIGIGTQNIIKNFVSGIILLVERKIRVGDTLEVEGFIGTVTEINTRSSVVRSADDMETIVPNSVFLESRVTNWTLTHAKVRRILQVGVAYESPAQSVMEVLTECVGRHGLVCKDPAPFAVFHDFGESAMIFHLYYWLDFRGTANGIVVASDLRLMIEKRFAELGIGVPFPQRDLRLSADHPLRILWAKDTEQGGEH